MRPRRSGGFCPAMFSKAAAARILFQLRPRRSGGFCTGHGLQTTGRAVSIAAPPERGILLHPQRRRRNRALRFQLRPRRSGGFCTIPLNASLAWSAEFQLRPRRSGGFCGVQRGPLSHRQQGFNCGPAGAGDFARSRFVTSKPLVMFQLRPRRSGGFCSGGIKGRWAQTNRFNCGPAGAGDFAIG